MSSDGRSAAPAWHADAVLLGVVLIWGVNIPVMKHALGELHPFAFNALRLALSTAFLGCMITLERWRAGGRVPERAAPWRTILALALIGSLFYQLLFMVGMSHTTAGNTGLLVGSVPLWTAVIASLCGIDRIRRSAWLGLLVAFGGVAVIAFEGGNLDLANENLTGNAMVLGAMVLWAVFTVMSKPVVSVMSPVRLAFFTSAIALPGHVVLALPHLESVLGGQISAGAWGAIVYSGVFSTGLAYVLWNHSVQKVGPSHTAVCNNLVPVVALLGSWVILRETVTVTQVLGGGMILGGLIAMRRTRSAG